MTNAAGDQIDGPAQSRFRQILIDVRVVDVQAGFAHGASGFWAINHERDTTFLSRTLRQIWTLD